MSSGNRKAISPAAIGEYLSFEHCSRFYKHRVNDIEETEFHDQNEFTEAFNPLQTLLSTAGSEFEEDVYQTLRTEAHETYDLTADDGDAEPTELEADHDRLFELIESAMQQSSGSDPLLIYQPTLTGGVKQWDIGGHADFILIWPTTDGVEIRVIDAKAAKEEQTHHQIQAAIYILLLKRAIEAESAVDIDAVTFSGGIITREDEFTPVTPDVVPSFDHQTRIDDSIRLLSDDGELAVVDNTPFAEADYQLNSKCASCEYNEACATTAFEEGHVKLLGLSESEQALLASHGVTSISDLADLCAEPNEEEWEPTRQKKASFESSEYRALKSQPGFGNKLPDLVYRAQAIEKQLSDTDKDTFPAAWIPGTGACELPDDEPPASFDYQYTRGSLVRVYLNVQYDHIRDKLIQLNARVSATESGVTERFSVLSDSAPDDEQSAMGEEQTLIEDFVGDLYSAIRSVVDGFGDGNPASETPLIHFYTYLPDELSHLVEACNRHDHQLINSFQDLLEGQAGSDVRRVSHLKPEISNRVCLTTPSYGLFHAYDELQPPSDDYSKSRKYDEWDYSPSYTSSSVNLRDVFNHGLFNITVDWDASGSGSAVDVFPDDHQQLDGLKTRFRFGASIPLGYLWSAVDRIDANWRDDVGIEKSDGTLWYEINSYLFHDHRQRDTRIQSADVNELGRSLCDLLEHVERSLVYRDASLARNKQPVSLSKLPSDSHDAIPIGTAARQYLRIEHTTQQRETYEQYRKLPSQRVLSGESLPVQITDIDEDAGHGLCVTVTGKLRYDVLYDDAHVERVKRICKQKGDEGTSSGDWMVSNPFDHGRTSQVVSEPYEIERGINATVMDIDMNTETVTFELRNSYWDTGEFESSHRNYTLNQAKAEGNDDCTYIEPGGWLILDPLTDSLSADRADKALQNADINHLHSLLEDLRYGSADALRETPFDESHLRTFRDWLQDTIPPAGYPNDQQAEFLTSTEQVTLLQGPPGTGKTAGTVAPSLLARIYAAEEQGTTVSGLITAPSNTAVDEALEATAELLSDVADEDAPGIDPDNIDIVRLTRREPDDAHSNVRYADYNIDSDQMFLSGVHEDLTTERTPGSPSGTSEQDVDDSQQTFGAFTDSTTQSATQDDSSGDDDDDRVNHTLVFSTPTKAWGLLKHFTEEDDDPTAIANQEFWNLLLIDEASMMTMPRLLLAGVAFQRDGQILVSGDHRQLPPVQKHDWEEENRRSMVETAPYLSGLDYFRLMSGDYDVLHDDTEDAYRGNISPGTNPIPMVQLNTTYRFGPDTADFIQSVVYDQDDIDYTSARSASDIDPQHTATTDSLTTAYESGEITLITYDSDQTFQQVNDLERVISMALIRSHHPDESVGIVTPHNAQRGRLRDMLKKLEHHLEQQPNLSNTIELDETSHVETVERFQGGQQDLMVVSATASNPQFIRSESGFLLEENRANVSFTRHEDKLIIIAAQSLLSHIPGETDIYQEASLWKSLSETVGEVPTSEITPEWSGTLREFVGSLTPPQRLNPDETTIDIYGL